MLAEIPTRLCMFWFDRCFCFAASYCIWDKFWARIVDLSFETDVMSYVFSNSLV